MAIVLSSAVVSGLVSVILGYVFDNKKYIRDKKLSVYSEFLDQYEKLIPSEDLTVNKSTPTITLEKARLASFSLEKYLWRVQLIAQDKDIPVLAEKLWNLSNDFVQATEELWGAEDGKKKEAKMKYDKICVKLNSTRKNLIILMNQDINKFF